MSFLDSISPGVGSVISGITGFLGQEETNAANQANAQAQMDFQERLSNTETFRSFLGDVVIPGLKDFGGSDTVEELKYLQGVYAGDTTVQPKALKAMLDRAEKKITSKISRIQEQQHAIQQGKPLPTGPMPTQAVRTWNPVTRKFE